MEDGDSDAIHSGLWPARGTDFLDDVDPNVTRESGIGSPVFPVFGGISRFPIPDRPGIGNRESGRFPIRPGTGNRGPDWPQIGKSGVPCGVSTTSTAGLDVALKVLQMQILASPHLPSSTAKDRRWRMTTRTPRWRTMGRTFRTMSTQTLMPRHVFRP